MSINFSYPPLLVSIVYILFLFINLPNLINLFNTNIIYLASFTLLILIIILIIYFITKTNSKSKLIKTTLTPSHIPNKHTAKLILKEKQQFIIKDYQQKFGREDFIGVLDSNELMLIGKTHFKITKNENGFYIKDLNSKNGTLLNQNDISGKSKVKLKNGDHISVAHVLELRYLEKNV